MKRSKVWVLVALVGTALLPACQSQEQKNAELVQAVLQRDEEAGVKLLGRGADPNQFTEDGTPLLTVAVAIDSEPLMEALLQARADVNLKSRAHLSRGYGWNALIEAASGFCPASVVTRLLAAGADPNIRTSSGITALMSLADPRTVEGLDKARVLVSAGADVNLVDDDGETALMRAAKNGNAQLVRFLGESDTDINRKNQSLGLTALMRGAYRGSTETVEILLDLGADVDALDNEGRTALMHAAGNGQEEVVTLLLDAGADPSLADKYGRTALTAAEANAFRAIASALRRSESRK